MMNAAAARTQEKAFNYALGEKLRSLHPRWPDRIDVERTGIFAENARLCPDIVIRHPGGLPVVIETEFAPAATVETDARERLGLTLNHSNSVIEQSIALRIPDELATVNQAALPDHLSHVQLDFCVLSSGSSQLQRWPESGWIRDGIRALATFIELTSLSEDKVARGMQVLELGITQATNILYDECARDAPYVLAPIAKVMHQTEGEQTTRMAMAIIANAMTFHLTIARMYDIGSFDDLRGITQYVEPSKLLKVWRRILTEINYWPIFRLASDILSPIPYRAARPLLNTLAGVAIKLEALGATSQHDLCGRMFQRLITDRKFLATFYTLPSSAAFLAELAVERLDIDWNDTDAVTALRIGDFACGTGALLRATYAAVMSRYRRAGGNDEAIHTKMMEESLIGTDIMPAATHLTATVLSSGYPRMTFEKTAILTLPYGEQPPESGRELALGALDLIADEKLRPLFGTGHDRMRGIESEGQEQLDLPHGGFDLVIMNPPFTRPTNHEATAAVVPSFAGFATAADEQRAMSQKLKQLKQPDMAGHGNAGLASNFIDVAHAKVKCGGVIALVLPAAFLQGRSWQAARRLLDRYYQKIVIVSIAAVGSTERAFSADTGMAEVLVIATRSLQETPSELVTFVTLGKRPTTILDATAAAEALSKANSTEDTGSITVGTNAEIGRYRRRPMAEAGVGIVSRDDVVSAATYIPKGYLKLPRVDKVALPITRLAELGNRGLLHRDISGKEIARNGMPRGPFDVIPIQSDWRASTWPMLWSHHAPRETRLVVLPDREGRVRSNCDKLAQEAWEKSASRLHFSLDFQLNSQPLAACLTPAPTLGGTAWPNFVCHDPKWEVPLALWSNTTLGLIAFWWLGTNQQQGRARLTISRLPDLPVLDPRKLSSRQLNQAQKLFASLKDQELRPANEAYRDKTRAALDAAVLVDLLKISSNMMEPLVLLRRQWCSETSVHGGKRNSPNSESDQPPLFFRGTAAQTTKIEGTSLRK
ncbi:MAG: hypothetical protein OXE94_04175 [Aestuariivita sp.]|nr:hypothetical protein [Aestuariivita sp.]MCY4202227.1 hypothetical protein [Aestuariivita sp.]